MKRVCLVSSFLAAALGGATVASAAEPGLSQAPRTQHADGYNAVPGILYVETGGVTLVPDTLCPVPGNGGGNAALNCGNVAAESTFAGFTGDAAGVVTGLETALAPYGIQVVTTRPPEYVPYQMVVVTDDNSDTSESETCVVGVGVDCDGPDRNDIGIVLMGGTMTCMTPPDPVTGALIAVGRMSGLEGLDNMADPMLFPPDFMNTNPVAFDDSCGNIVTPLNKMMNPLPQACINAVHGGNGMCMVDGEQNSHQELLAIYGPPFTDAAPPTIDSMSPDADVVVPEGMEFPAMTAMISDDSGYAGVRWVLESPSLIGLPMVDDTGRISKCTNQACTFNFDGGMGDNGPFKTTDTPFVFDDIGGVLPAGPYTLTLEVSDFGGNTLEMVTINITVEGDPPGGTGGNDSGPLDTGPLDSGGDSTSDDAGADGDGGGGGGGCTVMDASPVGGLAMLLGLVVIGSARRRRS